MSILEIAANYYQYFLRGTRTTILVALVTVFCGALLGCAIALMRLSKIKVLNWFSRLYITVIRGTPMLVQLYIVYFQLDFIKYPSGSIFGVDLERAIPCIIAAVHELGRPTSRKSSGRAFRQWIRARWRRPGPAA